MPDPDREVLYQKMYEIIAHSLVGYEPIQSELSIKEKCVEIQQYKVPDIKPDSILLRFFKFL